MDRQWKRPAIGPPETCGPVGHDLPREILQALWQPSDEAGGGITPIMSKDLGLGSVLFHRVPGTPPHCLDPDEDLVEAASAEVASIARPRSAAAAIMRL
jgi:hypothetical protein